MSSLSILIPARNEEFLAKTVEDLLKNIKGDTDIFVGLDGAWAYPGIPIHPKVTVVYHPEPIGQRAMTNELCRLSNAKYIMKTDAHCAFDKGFDVKLMEVMQDDWTIAPAMKNLHVFDWVCEDGHRRYQGPSGPCTECGKETKKDIVWYPKPSPFSTAYRFDTDLKFQYWGGLKKRQRGEVVETMSLQGSCFMLTREKYWDLNICDEGHGSWGQQGTEVACATWLSGGKVMIHTGTWYAHMFRTQGGDFGFPYELKGSDVEKARNYSKDLWLNNKHPKQIHPLSWLLEKFWPVDGWTDEDLKKLKDTKKGIIYYTDNRLNLRLAKRVQKLLKSTGLPIVSSSLKKMPHFGDNIFLPLERGYLTMFLQILFALEKSEAEYVFFCEHDVLYHPSHFNFTPKRDDVIYYNTNVYKTDGEKAYRVDDMRQVSGLCANRKLLIEHYKKRLKKIEENGFSLKMGFEPGTHNRDERVDDLTSETWESEFPNIDVRHGANLTETKWSPDDFRNKKYAEGWIEVDEIPGWGRISEII